MLFQLDCEIKYKTMKIDYRSSIMSFIKNALQNYGDGKFYDKYYSDTGQKDFTWTVLFTRPVFEKEEIKLGSEKISIFISTGDTNKTGLILFASFLAQKFKSFPMPDGNTLVLKDIRQLNQKIILHENCIFRSFPGSPLCVREHNRETNKDIYYTVNDEEFVTKVTQGLKLQAMQSGFSEEEVEAIEFKPLNCKKVVVLHYGVLIDTTIGIFEIKAPSMILQEFYQIGIGSRRSQGFGMIDLVAEK